MLAIATCYLVTMAVFPGMESEVVSCSLLDWMPILLLSVFHATDLAGKLLSGLGYSWSKGELVLWPLARLCLLPLILLCALPRHKPVFQVTRINSFSSTTLILRQNELIPLLLTGTLGISSGLFGSLPMIQVSVTMVQINLPVLQAPLAVSEEEREVVGNLMTASYCSGLTLGSLLAYWLDSLLGPPNSNPCPAQMATLSPPTHRSHFQICSL